jgi:hypothetical protein
MWPEKVRQDRPPGKLWRSFMRTADCPPLIFLSSVVPDISWPSLLDEVAEAKFAHGHPLSFSSCKIEYRNLGQELVTGAVDRMKVPGMGRLRFQFSAQLQNVVIDRPCRGIVLVSPHFIE